MTRGKASLKAEYFFAYGEFECEKYAVVTLTALANWLS